MREKKTYSSRYVACSEAMFETGGAGLNWRNPSKTCRTLRGSAMPHGLYAPIQRNGEFLAVGVGMLQQPFICFDRVLRHIVGHLGSSSDAPAWE